MLWMLITIGTPLAAQDCPAASDPGRAGSLTGLVNDASSTIMLPGIQVIATWEPTGPNELARTETQTDADGRYLLCSLPVGAAIELQAWFAGHSSALVTTVLSAERETQDLAVAVGGLLESAANQPSRVLGRVTDNETEQPIEGAILSLPLVGLQALSDAQGYFVIPDVPPGEHSLAIHHIGYGEVERPLVVPENRTVDMRIQLAPQAIEMEPLVVSMVRHPKLDLRGFYERKRFMERLGLGEFMTYEDVERRNPVRVSHMLEMIPSTDLLRVCSGTCFNLVVFGAQKRLVSPGRGQVSFVPCPADLYIDNIHVRLFRLDSAGLSVFDGIDSFLVPGEIAGIEVYRRASETPAEYGGVTEGCGAIVVWTK